jgi:3-methyl-2-oxobutanoate hydroxymethyltransferase
MRADLLAATQEFAAEVRTGTFPTEAQTFH